MNNYSVVCVLVHWQVFILLGVVGMFGNQVSSEGDKLVYTCSIL